MRIGMKPVKEYVRKHLYITSVMFKRDILEKSVLEIEYSYKNYIKDYAYKCNHIEFMEAYLDVIKEFQFSLEDIPKDKYYITDRGRDYLFTDKERPSKVFNVGKNELWFEYRGRRYVAKQELLSLLEDNITPLYTSSKYTGWV